MNPSELRFSVQPKRASNRDVAAGCEDPLGTAGQEPRPKREWPSNHQASSGKPAVVIGVYNQNIWFHVEGDHGASYWSSCRSKEDFQGKGFVVLASSLGSCLDNSCN